MRRGGRQCGITAFIRCVLTSSVVAGMLSGCSSSGSSAGPTSIDEMSFEEKARRLEWVCYSPTAFSPETPVDNPAAIREIREDLEALQPYFDGIITYGLSQGLDVVPEIAREVGFEGVIAGVWDIDSPLELEAATRLSREGFVDALCLGNEGLDHRYQWEDLARAVEIIRDSTSVPVTTTEQITDYGDQRLYTLDFILVNTHPLFHGYQDVDEAVDWFLDLSDALQREAGEQLVIVKETGFPSAGPDYCTEEFQAEYWASLKTAVRGKPYKLAFFEAFDQVWKHEDFLGFDVGPHWGGFRSDRSPKAVVDHLLDSREP